MSDNSGKQNRREFLVSVTRNVIISGLGLLGITLGYKSLNSNPESSCEVNLPCRNCFKLGNCNEGKAAKMRNEIKQHNQPAPVTNGKNNG